MQRVIELCINQTKMAKRIKLLTAIIEYDDEISIAIRKHG